MSDLSEQLFDIIGIGIVSFWPLAWGWWIVVICILAILVGCVIILVRYWRFRNSWRFGFCRRLKQMHQILDDENKCDIVTEISKILRSAGIRRYSRTSCAGLFGEEWLTWLQEHDKNGGFDWKKAAFLAEIPYRPESMNGVSQYKIQALISASITWIQVRGSDVDGVE